MVDAARGRGAPPPELDYAWQCQRWHALPEAGGLRDQPARLMRDMPVALNVYNAMRSFYTALKGPDIGQWQRGHPTESKIVGLIMRLEKDRG